MNVDEPRTAGGRPAEYTHTVAAVDRIRDSAAAGLLTGGFAERKGLFAAWDNAARPTPRAYKPTGVKAPRRGRIRTSLDPFISSRPVKAGAATMPRWSFGRRPARGPDRSIASPLLDLAAVSAGRASRRRLTARDWARPPIVAASPDGSLFAVTGDQNREIRVFAASDLFGKHPAPTILRSETTAVAGVAFARKGEPAELGLILRPAVAGGPADPVRELDPTDLVLDPGKRSLTPAAAGQGWKLVSAADAGWRVDRDAKSPTDISLGRSAEPRHHSAEAPVLAGGDGIRRDPAAAAFVRTGFGRGHLGREDRRAGAGALPVGHRPTGPHAQWSRSTDPFARGHAGRQADGLGGRRPYRLCVGPDRSCGSRRPPREPAGRHSPPDGRPGERQMPTWSLPKSTRVGRPRGSWRRAT